MISLSGQNGWEGCWFIEKVVMDYLSNKKKS